MLAAQIWTVVGVLLLIIEIFTADFMFASLGIACLIGGISAFMGAGFVVQVVVFAVSGVVIFITVRPFVKKVLQGENHARELGLNTLTGKKGVVTEEIVNSESRGRVKINGDLWRAFSENGENIEEGAHIVVKRSESITLYVERV